MKTRIADKVYAETDDHRHACEVKFVAKHKGALIKEYLSKILEKRGAMSMSATRFAIVTKQCIYTRQDMKLVFTCALCANQWLLIRRSFLSFMTR